ncbi:YciI family protein [Mycobacterium spongiae]|nr:YciI family protein [Mycobacterium spongiae]
MKYVLLLHLPAATGDPPPPPAESDMLAEFAAYKRVKDELQAEGIWLGGQALHPGTMTTQVRVRDDDALVVDGPLAETAEQVAGYYLVDCRDLDEAIAVAARIPGARTGTVEIRPVFDYEQVLTDHESRR